MRSNLFWLSDDQWQQIKPLLPTDVRGKERVDDRRVISGILHVLKIGCQWCDCRIVSSLPHSPRSPGNFGRFSRSVSVQPWSGDIHALLGSRNCRPGLCAGRLQPPEGKASRAVFG